MKKWSESLLVTVHSSDSHKGKWLLRWTVISKAGQYRDAPGILSTRDVWGNGISTTVYVYISLF